MTDPLKPSKGKQVSAIESRARALARLATRRLKLLREVDAIDGEIKNAAALLRSMVEDAVDDRPSLVAVPLCTSCGDRLDRLPEIECESKLHSEVFS